MRINCDTPWSELFFTLILAHECNLIPRASKKLLSASPNVYISNKNMRFKNFKLKPYDNINAIMLRKELTKIITSPVSKIYLCGKTEFPEIAKLNEGLDKNERKGDVYVQFVNGEFIAFSIKKDKMCTKTNWSIEKMIDPSLKHVRLQFLKDAGFPTHQKSKRGDVNKLFYKDNLYFKALRDAIELHKQRIINEFKQKLYGHYPYTMYEFDSYTLKKLSSIQIHYISFEEDLSFYYDASGKLRNCAKLFYKLKVNEDEYRVEVRWKGNVHCASPQFQTHIL